MVLRGGHEEVPTADKDADEACRGGRPGGGVEAVGARRKMYTCPGGSHSTDSASAWFCIVPSARGYLNHELPFELWERRTGVVDGNRAINAPQSAHDKVEEDMD